MSYIENANNKLAEFAEKTPMKGMHWGYLRKAAELVELYGEMRKLVEEDSNLQNDTLMKQLSEKIEKIVG